MGFRTARWTYTRRLVAASFLALIAADVAWLRGSLSATELFDVLRLTDPLAAMEVTLATRAPVQDVLVGATILLVVAAILGPVFCSWACPLGLLLNLNDAACRTARRLLRLPRKRSSRLAWAPTIRYAVLGTTVGFALTARMPAFQALSPINLVGWGATFARGPALWILVAIAVIEWFVPRLWCRAACPLGALYSLAARAAPFRVRIDPCEAGKVRCGLCTANCPMGIRVMEDYTLADASSVDDASCTRCGSCLDACPRPVLRIGFARGKPVGSPTSTH